MIIGLLDSQFPAVQETALAVVAATTGNSDCVADLAASACLGRLLRGLRFLQPPARITVLTTLHSLTSNTKLVREAHDKAAVLYLLDTFCNADTPGHRLD